MNHLLLRSVPESIPRPDYAMPGARGIPKTYTVDSLGRRKIVRNFMEGDELKRMRRACAAAREVLEEVLEAVRPGVTTEALDIIAHEACLARGGYPSPLGYRGFPKSLCTSINDVICHGIPSADTTLKSGDIINCDVTIYLDGMHGDCSETVFVGTPSQEARDLVSFTYKSLMDAIAIVKPGKKFNEIGKLIGKHAQRAGFSVVRDFSGHGIGPVFHMPPHVVHYYERRNFAKIKEGMTFTIEPMINTGELYAQTLDDGWTATTIDQGLSAQFEHTIYVGKRGAEILTMGEPRFKQQLKALDASKVQDTGDVE